MIFFLFLFSQFYRQTAVYGRHWREVERANKEGARGLFGPLLGDVPGVGCVELANSKHLQLLVSCLSLLCKAMPVIVVIIINISVIRTTTMLWSPDCTPIIVSIIIITIIITFQFFSWFRRKIESRAPAPADLRNWEVMENVSDGGGVFSHYTLSSPLPTLLLLRPDQTDPTGWPDIIHHCWMQPFEHLVGWWQSILDRLDWFSLLLQHRQAISDDVGFFRMCLNSSYSSRLDRVVFI